MSTVFIIRTVIELAAILFVVYGVLHEQKFIDFEDNDTLGVQYTSDDGTERFVVINKKCIIDIEVLYQQDIDILMYPQKTEEDVMYQ